MVEQQAVINIPNYILSSAQKYTPTFPTAMRTIRKEAGRLFMPFSYPLLHGTGSVALPSLTIVGWEQSSVSLSDVVPHTWCASMP